jgi:ISXO2-like transposase domain
MVGPHHKCEAQHLQHYLTEFEFRFNHRIGLGVNDKNAR